jgi:hypothetical protein
MVLSSKKHDDGKSAQKFSEVCTISSIVRILSSLSVLHKFHIYRAIMGGGRGGEGRGRIL